MHDILLPGNRLIRLRNSYRYPAQAALAARLPLAGRRVPMRGFWRHRSLRRARDAETVITSLLGRGNTAAAFCGGIARRGLTAARTAGGSDRARRTMSMLPGAFAGIPFSDATPLRMSRAVRPEGNDVRRPGVTATLAADRPLTIGVKRMALAACCGAAVMYYADPYQGRRRRALVRDRIAHVRNVFTHDVPRRVEKRGRFFRGVARGIGHDAVTIIGRNGHDGRVDDETLVARVRSEALRDWRLKAGEIHIDAYEGCVTLRGQLSSPADIRRLIEGTKRVEGVRDVRSYLHLPEQLPPNKAEVYEYAARHLPSL